MSGILTAYLVVGVIYYTVGTVVLVGSLMLLQAALERLIPGRDQL